MPSRRRTRRRRRCELYEELDARYVRYAVQIDKLVRKTGRKWKRLHAVRARQRRVLYKMLRFPAWCMSKALRRVKPYIADKELLREYENGVDSAQVYVHIHPHIRSSYVGQHKGVAATHKEQHDRSVLRVQLQLEGAHVKGGTSSWQRARVQRVHKFEGRNGGVGMWCDLPVQLFAPGYRKLDVLRGERQCSNRIGNLNVQGHALQRQHVRAARTVRRGRDHRAVCRMRGCDPERERERVRATVFAWRDGDQRVSSTCLVHTLRTAKSRVTVHIGSLTHTNWRTLQSGYGKTILRVRLAGGATKRVRVRKVLERVFTWQVPWREQVLRLQVLEVRQCSKWRDTVQDELVQVLARTRTGGRDLLKLMNYRDLEIMWSRAKQLDCARERESVRGRLAAHARKGWGVSLLARPVVRVPMSTVFPRAAMVAAVQVLFDLLGSATRPQISRLARRVRLVRAQPKTIGGELCNWR